MSDFIHGDVDGDGKVDHSDLLILKHILQNKSYGDDILATLSPEERARLDINQDGEVTYDDVVRLMKIIASNDEKNHALKAKFDALRQRYEKEKLDQARGS